MQKIETLLHFTPAIIFALCLLAKLHTSYHKALTNKGKVALQ